MFTVLHSFAPRRPRELPDMSMSWAVDQKSIGGQPPPLCCDFVFVACVYTLLLKMEVDLAL